MTTPIRLALVGYGSPRGRFGCGRGGNLFRMAVESFKGIVPTAVCDLSPSVLAHARRTFPGIRTYLDFDRMLSDAAMDAVFIATPATCHAGFAAAALARDIHVLSEIPAVTSIAEARRLWAAHRKSRALYMAGANPNFWGFVDAAVELKQRGLLGEPVYVEASYIHDVRSYFKRTPWRATYEPIRYCTHSLGPVLRLIREDLEWVACFDTGGHIQNARGRHDVMAALFRTKSNVVVRLVVSFINNYVGGQHAYRVLTTKGCFERTPSYQTARRESAEGPRTLFYSQDLKVMKQWIELPVAEMPPALASNPKAGGHGGADYAVVQGFFEAIRRRRPSPVSLRESLRMALPGIYAAESARRGGHLVRIRYPWQCAERRAHGRG